MLAAAVGAMIILSKRSAQVITQERAVEEQKKTEEQKKQDPLKRLSGQPALGFWFSQDTLYYLNGAGQIYSVNIQNGEEKQVSSYAIENVRAITPSAKGDGALITFSDRGENLVSMYRVAENSWTPLDKNIRSAAWSPDGQWLAQLRETFGGVLVLELVKLSGGERTELARLSMRDARLTWIGGQQLIVSSPPSKDFPAPALTINVLTKTVSPLALEKPGLSFAWSASGKQALAFWVDDNGKNQTALVNDSGVVLKNFQTPLLPHKCAFSGEQQLYCGVPANVNLATVADLPDAYLMQKVRLVDHVALVDAQTSRLKIIFSRQEPSLDIYKPHVHDNKLFFINRYDGAIYSLEL